VIGLPAFAGAEHLVDRRARHRFDELPEMAGDRVVGERAGGAEVGDPQRLLECEASRHHLPEDTRNRLVRQRSAVCRLQPREDLRFALGPVRDAVTFDRANRPACAARAFSRSRSPGRACRSPRDAARGPPWRRR
jgi:hypothetical protein